ncbi:type 2 isopentenyl-diphosphate Delta-isomerase [bacterium]|nr:type 2 isopentenyl-diphosphate Delta-isomerase [bacterium]
MKKKKKSPSRSSLTVNRKKEHVEISLDKDVAHHNKTAGFERYEFVHNALPELHLKDIDPSVDFLNRRLSIPLLITGMTGGYDGAVKINAGLAEVCESMKIAMGVGSQRQLIEDDSQIESYRIARKKAPTIPIIGNIGAAQIAKGIHEQNLRKILDIIEANAIAVHLNALQEAVQYEGDLNFKGVLSGIEQLVLRLNIPVIVKETGAGISSEVAQRLYNSGVRYIDVSGAGGTSWSAVESFRKRPGEKTTHVQRLAKKFWNWGIPTADCIVETSKIRDLFIIASGGIKDGVDIAKSLALGASMAGMARPLLKKLMNDGIKGLSDEIDFLKKELCLVMFLTGSDTITTLKQKKLIRYDM